MGKREIIGSIESSMKGCRIFFDKRTKQRVVITSFSFSSDAPYDTFEIVIEPIILIGIKDFSHMYQEGDFPEYRYNCFFQNNPKKLTYLEFNQNILSIK